MRWKLVELSKQGPEVECHLSRVFLVPRCWAPPPRLVNQTCSQRTTASPDSYGYPTVQNRDFLRALWGIEFVLNLGLGNIVAWFSVNFVDDNVSRNKKKSKTHP